MTATMTNTDIHGRKSRWRSWWKFAVVSLIFFQITAATFTSLGVALPFMIKEFSWSWSDAGIGFSLLAFMVGIAGRLPSWMLRKFGIRATYGIGGVTMALGLGLLATTADLRQYFVGAALAGLGFTLGAIVPGVAGINYWLPHRRSFAIGAYMTIGGLGGVAGPLLVTMIEAVFGSWRMHWWLMAASILFLALLAVISLGSIPDHDAGGTASAGHVEEKHSKRVYKTRSDWCFRNVLRTPQYYVIVAAMTMVLFGGVTTSSWAVAHMGTLGIPIVTAAGALSADAFVRAFSGVLGGALATRIDPKWLLVSALVAETMGMIALSSADNMTAIVLFSFGEGYGFGMCLFATTVLLNNYYGPKEAPKTLGTMHLITTVAMLGPVLGGIVADGFGNFAGLFRAYALFLLVCLFAVAIMRPPSLPGQNEQA
ncbi:MAG: CynX/NimT family MFS transporter [Woeseia sp.]